MQTGRNKASCFLHPGNACGLAPGSALLRLSRGKRGQCVVMRKYWAMRKRDTRADGADLLARRDVQDTAATLPPLSKGNDLSKRLLLRKNRKESDLSRPDGAPHADRYQATRKGQIADILAPFSTNCLHLSSDAQGSIRSGKGGRFCRHRAGNSHSAKQRGLYSTGIDVLSDGKRRMRIIATQALKRLEVLDADGGKRRSFCAQ